MSDSNSVLDIRQFAQVCEQHADPRNYPNATGVEQNVVLYDGKHLRSRLDDGQNESVLRSELAHCLLNGPGVFVVRSGYPDVTVIEKSTAVLQQIVADEKASGKAPADHFGNNERVWNSLQKACVADPRLFVEYYSNSILHLASEAWLGPNYRITAQMNNVKPGGQEQSAHRDYHLGFQSAETVAQFPVHAQVMSQHLTLQGAIAHSDMAIENGPTLFLPFSHQYPLGYLAQSHSDFVDYFSKRRVQLPLAKGDMVFFNPALFHAGGSNSTDSDRIANLVQVSSAFGRTMETINHPVMIQSVYPVLRGLCTNDSESRKIRQTIATITDGYAFPTNLDTDPPADGNAPETQASIVINALAEDWPLEKLMTAVQLHAAGRRAN